MPIEIINPFYFSPVSHPELLAGRSQQKQRMINKSKDASSKIFHHSVLLGEAGMGKTSMLNVYEDYVKSEHADSIVSRIDLDETLSKSNDPLDVFKGLETRILKEMRNRDADLVTYVSDIVRRFGGVETGALSRKSKVEFDLQLPYFGGVSWESTIGRGNYTPLSVLLKSDFEELRHRAEERGANRIILMIDDADVLKTLPDSKSVLQLLKNTFQNLQGYMIVLSGNLDLLRCLSEVSLGFSSLLDPINLDPLSLEESKELIRARLDFARKLGPTVEFTETAEAKIVQGSGGNPRELVRLCYMAVEKIRGKSDRVDTDVVQNLI